MSRRTLPKNWVESLALLGRLYMMYDIKNSGQGKQPLEKPSHRRMNAPWKLELWGSIGECSYR